MFWLWVLWGKGYSQRSRPVLAFNAHDGSVVPFNDLADAVVIRQERGGVAGAVVALSP